MMRIILGVLIFLSLPNYAVCVDLDWQWALTAGQTTAVRGLIIDQQEDICFTGSFSPQLELPDTTLISYGLGDLFVAKVDQSGDFIWIRQFGGEYGDQGIAITRDSENNILVAGEFFSNCIEFSPFVLYNNWQTPYLDQAMSDIFLLKLNSLGEVIWATSAGGILDDHVIAVAVDEFDHIYLTGTFWSDPVHFDLITLDNTGNKDIYLAAFSSNGSVLWADRPIDTGQDDVWDLGIDNLGRIFIAGGFRGNTISFGPHTLVNTSADTDLFLCRYNNSGEAEWLLGAIGEDWDQISTIAFNDSDNLYFCGHFSSDSLIIAGTTLYLSPSQGFNRDLVLGKLDLSGVPQWFRTTSGKAWIYPGDIIWDPDYGLFISGTFTGNNFGNEIIFGNTTIEEISSYDLFLVHYDSLGIDTWSAAYGSQYMDFAQDLGVSASGLVLAANFDGPEIQFDEISLNHANPVQFLVARALVSSSAANGISLNRTFHLNCFPNPFNSSTNISFYLPDNPQSLQFSIFNLRGQLIRQLYLSSSTPAYYYEVCWDGLDTSGDAAGSGIYLYQLRFSNLDYFGKITLLK